MSYKEFFKLEEAFKTLGYIVAEDHNPQTGSKKFLSFPDFESFTIFYNKRKAQKFEKNENVELNYYEIVRENEPCKPYFDFDMKVESLELAEKNSKMIIKKVEEEIVEFIESEIDNWNLNFRNFEEYQDEIKFLAYTANQPTKCSIHGIFDGIYFINNTSQKEFWKRFGEYSGITKKFTNFDPSVYSKNRLIRGVYSTKKGKNFPLIPANENAKNYKDFGWIISPVDIPLNTPKIDPNYPKIEKVLTFQGLENEREKNETECEFDFSNFKCDNEIVEECWKYLEYAGKNNLNFLLTHSGFQKVGYTVRDIIGPHAGDILKKFYSTFSDYKTQTNLKEIDRLMKSPKYKDFTNTIEDLKSITGWTEKEKLEKMVENFKDEEFEDENFEDDPIYSKSICFFDLKKCLRNNFCPEIAFKSISSCVRGINDGGQMFYLIKNLDNNNEIKYTINKEISPCLRNITVAKILVENVGELTTAQKKRLLLIDGKHYKPMSLGKILNKMLERDYVQFGKKKFWTCFVGDELFANNPKIFQYFGGFRLEKIKLREVKSYQLFLDHLFLLSGKEEKIYDYLIKWQAHIIQKPQKKTEVAIVLFGKEGTGKSTFVNLLAELVGKKYINKNAKIDNGLTKFNSLLFNKLITVFNETKNYGKGISEIDSFKSLITEKEIVIEKKGFEPQTVNDYNNFIITTNHYNSIKISSTDRRFLCCETADDKVKNFEYFDKLNKAIKDEAILKSYFDFLKSVDLKGFNLRAIPQTKLKEIIQEVNKSSIELYIDEILSFEHKPTYLIEYKNDYRISYKNFYQDFLEWNNTGSREKYKKSTFKIQISKSLDLEFGRIKIGSESCIGIKIPKTMFK